MFETFDEIRNNIYLSKLEELALQHQIDGAYVQYMSERNPNKNDIYFLCGVDAKAIIQHQTTGKNLLENKSEKALSYYRTHLFKLTDCDPQKTYEAIKTFCQDAEILKDIYNNKQINALDKAVSNFGMYGSYIFYNKNIDSDFTGLYFVCGTDKNQVFDENINIKELLQSQNKNSDLFYHRLTAFPLDSQQSFVIHQAVLDYCRNSEFVRNLYKQYQKVLPDCITFKALEYFKMLNSNLKNPSFNVSERVAYEKALKECMEIEDAYHNPNNPKYEKHQFLLSGQYDTTKGPVANWFRQNFGQANNCVTLEHLVTDCNGHIGRMTINVRIADQVKKALKQRPDILYWMSEPMGEKFDFPEGQGFGLFKEDNDPRTIDLVYNGAYEQDVNNIIYQINYPEEYKIGVKDLEAQGFTPTLISISQNEYQNFKNLCKSNGVPFCIDKEWKLHSSGQVNVLVPKEKMDIVDKILTRLCLESERFKISLDRPVPVQEITGIGAIYLEKSKGNNSAFGVSNGNVATNSFDVESVQKKLNERFPDKNFIPVDDYSL